MRRQVLLLLLFVTAVAATGVDKSEPEVTIRYLEISDCSGVSGSCFVLEPPR